jgi:uncharacterized protein YhjY with autotransporter beta-barrel domain
MDGRHILVGTPALMVIALLLQNPAGAQTTPKPPTPNENSLYTYLNAICPPPASPTSAFTPTPAQEDLALQCRYFMSQPHTAMALLPILGMQINALGPETKKFGSLQQDNVTARLAEVRHGATGVSLSGLTLVRDDGTVVASNTSGISDFLPGGGSGDGNGEWFDGRLGIFANGDIQEGSKTRLTAGNYAFNVKNDSVTVGADYRIGQQFVVGAAYASGKTRTDFENSMGRLDLNAKGVNLYASVFGETYYVDLLAGYGEPRLDTDRHIQYADVDQDAYGSTHLHDLWTGLSAGRPFNWGAFALTPEGSVNYHEIRLSEFSETMSQPGAPGSGLGLTFGNASVPSLQARAGLRAAYTVSTSWGVFEPNVHGTFIREFRDYSDTFNAQFESASQSSSNLAYVLHTDPPEAHYTANGGGIAFHLAHSIAGFIDYEELHTLRTIKSHEFSFSLRYQLGGL